MSEVLNSAIQRRELLTPCHERRRRRRNFFIAYATPHRRRLISFYGLSSLGRFPRISLIISSTTGAPIDFDAFSVLA
jgi:hypothetical protein